MVFYPNQACDEAGIDDIFNNARVRATRTPQVVRSVTFPANTLGTCWFEGTGTPVSLTSGTNFTIDTGQLLTGIVVLKPTASVNVTFDTAAQMVASLNLISAGVQVGDYLCATIINGAAATFTLSPQVSTGVTFDANQAATSIAAGTSRYFMFRFTNVTPGSEAVVAYW
jgi:hypothetical protein